MSVVSRSWSGQGTSENLGATTTWSPASAVRTHVPGNVCADGVAPVPGLEPQSGDLVVEKMTMSAWETSRLERYIRSAGRDTIINTGAWTNMSVEHTARTAADKGYRVIVPEDSCSTINAEWHNASINFAMQNVAEVVSTDNVISAL